MWRDPFHRSQNTAPTQLQTALQSVMVHPTRPDYHSFELSQGFLEFGRVGWTSINGCPDRVANVTDQRGAPERWDGLKVMSA